MFLRRVSIPIVLTLTLLLQFVPGTVFAPQPVAASSCNVAQFISDVTIPDGTAIGPGTTFVKTWRLKNIGSCTWTSSYAAVFTGGDQMGAPSVVYMPYSVAPGATVDVSVNLTAPSTNGHYRGNWKLRNASGTLFGVGASGSYIFWVDIYVNSSSTSGTTYDFVSNYCLALWASAAGGLACPGSDGNANGFVLNVSSPQLETGSFSSTPGLVANPQQVTGGFIKGYYPAYTVHAGDHFQSIINCAYGASNCYVNFRLDYQIGGGAVQTFWTFNERYDGLYYPVNLDLSSLAGQSVNFILYVADVSGHGTPSGDRAVWVGPRITGTGSSPVPIPPSSTCNKGAFVSDVTIPDGTVLTPGSPFTKTWRIRNVGSCTWTTDYALVYVFGYQLGAAPVVNLPSSVAPVVPGATADFSVSMVAPSTPGHYRSYWRFRNASGGQFGVGSGMITFFADINVGSSGLNGTTTTITADSADPSTPGQSVGVSATVYGTGATPTGTVSITGADTNCSMSLAGGTGTCYVVFNSAGAKTLTATYSGDSYYTSSYDSESHTVTSGSAATSTTNITADTPDPSGLNQSVPVSVTVSGTGATPTGTVSITGADNNCTLTLSSGTGSCNVKFTNSGSKTLTATYSGDGNYNGSSDTESHTVSTTQGSVTKITADTPDPSIPGAVVDVDVTVTGAGTYPTGTVAISGTDSNCTITLDADATGNCSVIFNSGGAKTITATYSGNANYAGSTDTESHNVSTGYSASATTITADTPDPSVPGQPVVVYVTVNGAGVTTPTGTVEITGAHTDCSFLLASGSGSCSVVFNSTGHKTIKATYGGDGKYSSSSGTAGHEVIKGSTTTTITANTPNPSLPSQAVEVEFSVVGAGDTPTGTVAITGADNNCSITLSGANGSCKVVFNTIGPKLLTAAYSGDSNYLPSTSIAVSQTVENATTTSIVSDINDPSFPNDSVDVTVTVTGTGATTPSGSVAITGADTNCSIVAFATIGVGIGQGTCTVVFSTAGAKILTATYSGDGNYVGSVGTATHTVSRGPSVTIINSDDPDASVPFETVVVSVTVTGFGVTPTGTVAINITGQSSSCTITLASGTGTCNLLFKATGSYTITAIYSGDANYLGSTDTEPHIVS